MALFSSKDVPPAKPQARDAQSSMGAGGTFFGPNITIEGTITGAEPIVVEGTIRGKINVTGDLRIGPQARVEASVHAKNVIVEGRLNGDLSADDRVELIASASVDGNIKAPKIIVAEGAKFRGAVDMGSARPKENSPDHAKESGKK